MNPNNNQWVYYNGELYHAGVKGMQWGKHLPGTTWWKEAVGRYSVNNPGQSHQKVRANLYAAGQAAKLYGGYIKNNAKVLGKYAKNKVSDTYKYAKDKASVAYKNIKTGTSKLWNKTKGYTQEQINKFRESAKKSYKQVRKEVSDVIKAYYNNAETNVLKNEVWTVMYPKNNLSEYYYKELDDATTAYRNAKLHSSFSNDLNLLIQTCQYNISRAVAENLKAIGLDDDVARFLNKLKKKG